MGTAGGSGRPGGLGATRKAACHWLAVLAPSWFLVGAIGAGWLFVLSTSPFGDAGVADPFSGLQAPPAWTGISAGAGSWIDLAGAVAFVPWLLLSIPVFMSGLRRLSRGRRPSIWPKAAWACRMATGAGMAVLIITSFHFPPPYISSARAVSWGELAIALGFLLLAIPVTLVTSSRTSKDIAIQHNVRRTGGRGGEAPGGQISAMPVLANSAHAAERADPRARPDDRPSSPIPPIVPPPWMRRTIIRIHSERISFYIADLDSDGHQIGINARDVG